MKILIVDDEPKILDVIEAYLVVNGHLVYRAETGSQALEKYRVVGPDLIILDWMLPDSSGMEVCQEIRLESSVPIIMLTAKAGEKNIISGLKMGADDYVVKPFSPKELVMRVETVLRRTGYQAKMQKIKFNDGKLMIDVLGKQVFQSNQLVCLTGTEFDLLQIFAESPEQIFSREQLIEHVKGIEFDGMDRVIDSHIKNLRQKIEDNPKKPEFILTVHGRGYRFGGKK